MRRSLLIALPLLLAGCGSTTANSTGGTDGKSLFAGKCGACHTLKAAGTTGTFGPNLDDLKPSKALVRRTIKAGPGPMPAGLYDGKQADAVAAFVSSSAGK